MRQRLYFMLPDVPSARSMLDEMLLARIEERHLHFLGKRGALPNDMPEASMLQKTDIVHGAQMGLVVGGAAGTLGGVLVVLFPPGGVSLQLVTILITALLGCFFGAWVSSMVGTQVPNSHLKAFHSQIALGKVLMMVDVPFSRIKPIRELVAQRHPEAEFGGMEAVILAFP